MVVIVLWLELVCSPGYLEAATEGHVLRTTLPIPLLHGVTAALRCTLMLAGSQTFLAAVCLCNTLGLSKQGNNGPQQARKEGQAHQTEYM